MLVSAWWPLFHCGVGKEATRASWGVQRANEATSASWEIQRASEATRASRGVQKASEQWSFHTPEQMLCPHTFSVLGTHSASELVYNLSPQILYILGFFIFRIISTMFFPLSYSNPPTKSSVFFTSFFSCFKEDVNYEPQDDLELSTLLLQHLKFLAGATIPSWTLSLTLAINHQRNPLKLCYHTVLQLRYIVWDSLEKTASLCHKMGHFVTDLITSLLIIFHAAIINYLTWYV